MAAAVEPPRLRDLNQLVRECIEQVRADGLVPTEVIETLESGVRRDPKLARHLLRLRSNPKPLYPYLRRFWYYDFLHAMLTGAAETAFWLPLYSWRGLHIFTQSFVAGDTNMPVDRDLLQAFLLAHQLGYRLLAEHDPPDTRMPRRLELEKYDTTSTLVLYQGYIDSLIEWLYEDEREPACLTVIEWLHSDLNKLSPVTFEGVSMMCSDLMKRKNTTILADLVGRGAASFASQYLIGPRFRSVACGLDEYIGDVSQCFVAYLEEGSFEIPRKARVLLARLEWSLHVAYAFYAAERE